jgi:hypothetical protein
MILGLLSARTCRFLPLIGELLQPQPHTGENITNYSAQEDRGLKLWQWWLAGHPICWLHNPTTYQRPHQTSNANLPHIYTRHSA